MFGVILNSEAADIFALEELNSVRIYADDISASAGETITVSVYAEDINCLMGFSILINYDKDVFTPTAVNAGDLLSNGVLNDSVGSDIYNELKVVYTASEGFSGSGKIFDVNLNVSQNAKGSYSFVISYIQSDTFDENFDDVIFECESFSAEIINPALENSPRFYSDDIQADCGTDFSVPIYLCYPCNVTSFELLFEYDESKLTFLNIESSIGGNLEYDCSSGIIELVWNGDAISEETQIINLYFSAVENTSFQSEIYFTCSNAVFDNMDSLLVSTSDITIDILNPSEGLPTIIYSNSEFRINNGFLEIPLFIKNNHGIMGFDISVEYDETVITPFEVIASELLSSGYCDNNINMNTGIFKILWNGAEDMDDDGLLLTLKFNVADGMEPETIPLNISYSQPDTYNENWEDVELDIDIDEISVNYYYTATFTSNGEVIGTDIFRLSDGKLDYPLVEYRPYYEFVWDEHELLAEDIIVNGEYIPITYSITFVSNGVTVSTQEFTIESYDTVIEPELSLPEKEGYNIAWEEWKGKIQNLTVNEVYVPIYKFIYYRVDGKVVATRPITIDTKEENIIVPALPNKEGYTAKWEDYEYGYRDIYVDAIFTLIEYTAEFVIDGEIVSTQKFTIETKTLDEPEIPPKAGYCARWQGYVLGTNNIIICAVYDNPTAIMISQKTIRIGESFRAFSSANFDVHEKTWTSSNPTVATVDNHGNVYANNTGKTTITVVCEGVDSLGNKISAKTSMKVYVQEESQAETFKEKFREAFDNFFENILHDWVEIFRKAMLEILRFAN